MKLLKYTFDDISNPNIKYDYREIDDIDVEEIQELGRASEIISDICYYDNLWLSEEITYEIVEADLEYANRQIKIQEAIINNCQKEIERFQNLIKEINSSKVKSL